MPGTRCLRVVYYAAIVIVVLLAAAIILLSYSPRTRNLLRYQLAKTDVIVVGGGLAGLSAAIEASRHGARVTIIEKTASLGGNSAKATSGINGVGTKPQEASEIEDSIDTFISDTIKSGGGLSNPALVEILARQSSSAIDFLLDFGLNLTDVIHLGGHSIPRTHRIPPTPDGRPVPVGFTIVSTLRKYVETELPGAVDVILSATFKNLLTDKKGRVIGVEFETSAGVQSLKGNVILTAGGYANDHTDSSLLEKHVPQLASLPTTNGPWATGDILKATSSNGLSLVHMDQVQIHPTGFIEPANPKLHTKFLAPESLRGCGAILLNRDGKRFVNELGRRDHVTAAIYEKCSPFNNNPELPVAAVMLMNAQIINKFGRPAAEFYMKKGIIEDVGSLEELASRLSVDVAILRETLTSYQNAAGEGEDEFGKVTFVATFEPKDHFYIAHITPTLHYCMGGLEISERGEVLRGEGKQAVQGLYAAGEVTGGVHGMNRLGGNSLLDCVVFGRVAGGNAAHFSPTA